MGGLGYRAMLEKVCCENGWTLKKTKRKSAQNVNLESFEEYIKTIVERYDICDRNGALVDPESVLRNRHVFDWEEKVLLNALELVTGLQLSIQEVLENFILLDRIQYLKENLL